MEARLQQRIVGAIVLVTLGVIFIPALLDGSGYKSRQVQDIEIGEKPEFPPASRKKLEPIATPLDQFNKSSQATAIQNPQQQAAELKSFALQTGTFASTENAEKMRDELIKAGYATFVYKDTSKGQTSYKVRIGPELEYSVLEKIKQDIKTSHKIDAYIVNHP